MTSRPLSGQFGLEVLNGVTHLDDRTLGEAVKQRKEDLDAGTPRIPKASEYRRQRRINRKLKRHRSFLFLTVFQECNPLVLGGNRITNGSISWKIQQVHVPLPLFDYGIALKASLRLTGGGKGVT